MASLTDIPAAPLPGGDGLYLGPVPGHRRGMALAQLLTGRPREDDPAVAHFEQFARDQGLDTRGVWVACTGSAEGKILASVLLVPNAGATAMLFPGSSAGWRDPQAAIRLIREVCQSPITRGVRVVQSLLDTGQVIESRALERAGLTRLAKLVYMQRPANPREHRVARPTTLGGAEVACYGGEEANRARVCEAVLASYEDTQDCPGLLGLRPIEMVVEGHRATGRFHASLWHAFFDAEDRPVAALLLAEVAQGGAHEVVYLGVSKPYRGRGIGGQLMAYALSESTRRGGSRVFLAVDDRNDPAVRLYHGLGFRATARKVAFIMPCGTNDGDAH